MAHVQRVSIRFGVNRHGADTEFLTGSDYSNCNFAPIYYQDLFKHFSPKAH